MNTPYVTFNITAHKEGYYLYHTLRSVEENRQYAAKNGIFSIVHINLDKADKITSTIAESFCKDKKDYKIFINEFGDLSSSRNFLIDHTETKYLIFVDGDDLFSANFLTTAFFLAEEYGKDCVISAEDIVKFGASIDPIIFKPESTIKRPEIKSAIFETNVFVSQNFVSTNIFNIAKYEILGSNYGFEDWHWNTKVLNAGYEFLIASDTIFFYRQKADDKSLLKQHTNTNTVIRASELFTPQKFASLPHIPYTPFLSDSLNPTKTEYENIIRKYGRNFLNFLLGTGIFYRIIRKIYKIAQHTAAPYIHKARHLKDLKSEDILSEEFSSSNNHRTLEPYILSESKKKWWKKMNQIEPLVRYDYNVLSQLHVYRYSHEHLLATAYMNFCNQYKDINFTDIIFVPWIHSGGADLAMLRLASTLSQQRRKVMIITTSGVDSQWVEKARGIDGVTFIQSHDPIFQYLDHKNIKTLFLRLIQNWNIKTITIMNSSIGFELVERYGKAIKDSGCSIIVHSYAFPIVEDQLVDAFPSMSAGLEYIDNIIVDSHFYKEQLRQIYGLDTKKVTTILLPIEQDLHKKKQGLSNRILFANRIAREKQPLVAIETLSLLEDKGICMDIYGARDEHYCNTINFDEKVKQLDNVIYKGMYKSSKELDFNLYDICFMPSLYEGTPNIALESASAGLYIVATDTGGLPEIIEGKYTGVILSTDSKPEDFANAITSYYANTELHSIEKRYESNQPLLDAHKANNYKKQILDIYK